MAKPYIEKSRKTFINKSSESLVVGSQQKSQEPTSGCLIIETCMNPLPAQLKKKITWQLLTRIIKNSSIYDKNFFFISNKLAR